MTQQGAMPSETRSWRPLRLMIVVTLIVLLIQFFLGEGVSAAATYPTTIVPINSIGDLFSAMSSAAGPILFVHAFTGILLFLMILGTMVVAIRYHNTKVTRTSLLGLVSIIFAVLGGYIWAGSDFSNGGGILLMVNGAIAAYSFLFLTLYYTK